MFHRVEQAVAPVYRQLRRMKNRVLNLVDAPVVVLAYHRVAQLSSDPHQIAVTPDNFRAHMRYLRQNCQCVRLDDDWAGLQAPAVAVTFDDGYADNFYQALPILEEEMIPATFFISTGQLGTRNEFWSDELAALVLGGGDRPREFHLQDPECDRIWPSDSCVERLDLHAQLHALMLTTPPQRREESFGQLRRWAGVDRISREAFRALTCAELQGLAASPLVTIGAHGVTHTPLAALSADEQRDEIAGSRRRLEALLNREVAVFAYPFGGKGQYDRTTLLLCREAGFRRAVTTLPGQVHRWTDPLRIPRQLVRDWDVQTFTARLEAFWSR